VVRLFVEGGGDSKRLHTACREGVTIFITKAGLVKRPRVVACGSRSEAFDSFCTAIAQGEESLLLVDSEAALPEACLQPADNPMAWRPWTHLAQRRGDGWIRPDPTADTDCHLMAQCMETWFLADRDALARFFGHGFRPKDLPDAANPIESVAKTEIYRALERATRDCKTKNTYGKGEHSFKLLAAIDPAKVTAASPWARRFVDSLKAKMAP
jgi:hypothetical protein